MLPLLGWQVKIEPLRSGKSSVMLLPQVAPVGSSWARAVGITHVVAPHFGAGRVDLLGSSILTDKSEPPHERSVPDVE